MPSYDSTSRTPFKTGGRVGLNSGSTGSVKKKKKETWKEKKKRKRKEESQRVSRETLHEAVRDIKTTKGKVHSLKSSRQDAADRMNKLIKKQVYFHPEKDLQKGFSDVPRDKGWGGKHSRKVENN